MPTKSSLSPKFVKAVQIIDDHLNGISIPIGNPMGMEIDGTIGSGNGKEWESPRMGNGNGPYSHGNKFPSVDAVFSLYNSNVLFII